MQTFSRDHQRPLTTDGISLNAPYKQGENRPSSQSPDDKQRYGATRTRSAFLRKPPKPNRYTNKLQNTEQITRRRPGTPLPAHKKLQAAQKTQYIAIVSLFFLAFFPPKAHIALCIIYCLPYILTNFANMNNRFRKKETGFHISKFFPKQRRGFGSQIGIVIPPFDPTHFQQKIRNQLQLLKRIARQNRRQIIIRASFRHIAQPIDDRIGDNAGLFIMED